MFRFLTPTAKEAILRAQALAEQRGLMVEADLVAGLLSFREAAAAQALIKHLDDLDRLQFSEPTRIDVLSPTELAQIGIDDGHLPGGAIAWDRTCAQVVSSSRDEANRLRHRYIGTEHLLLGLLRAGGQLPGMLADYGVDLDALRRTVRWSVAPGEVEIEEQLEVFFELRRTGQLTEDEAKLVLDTMNREYQEAIAFSLATSAALSRALPGQGKPVPHPWRGTE